MIITIKNTKNKYFIAFFLAILFIIFLIGCNGNNSSKKEDNIPPEEYIIFAKVLLTYLEAQNSNRNDYNIIDSVPITDYTQNDFIKVKGVKEHLISLFGEQLSQKLLTANIFQYKIKNEFDSSITKKYNINFVVDNKGFYFSRIAFNGIDKALLYFADNRMITAGIGYMVLLKKNDGLWEIEEMIMLWIS